MISKLTVLESHHVCKCGIFQSINNFKCCYSNSSFYFYHVSLTQEEILMDVFCFSLYMKDQVNYYSLYENCVKVYLQIVWQHISQLLLFQCWNISRERMKGISAYFFSPTSLVIQGSTFLQMEISQYVMWEVGGLGVERDNEKPNRRQWECAPVANVSLTWIF